MVTDMVPLNTWLSCSPMSHCSASLSSACSPKYLGSVVKDANVIKQLLLLKMLFYTEPGEYRDG